ncbi:Transcriptional regulator [Paraburkholderia piptadeniae]|uniref:Transcriptional regulator n=1 Tax=Paraburkholderia piptadeniae TaxID=1701573 RepID=A0A1N7SPS2_9BURK|nr:GntR family transcriptional regulator [Paraburkholderia piptadeniae]SIT49336.1 Transcriptional regulator [Paraburkholderia piptadeniae]
MAPTNTMSRLAETDALAGKMSATAYVVMKRRILDNVWPAGFQATEADVSEELGMSRTPVREALMRLQQDGLIKVMPRHGMRVLPVSPDDMQQIYQILTSLEATAAELVAARGLTREQLQPLMLATQAMDEALKRDDLDAWAIADERFHTHLLELCGNEMLRAVVLNFWDRAHRARMVTLRIRPKPVHSTKEHQALVSALLKGDVGKAGAIQRAHRERAKEELLGLLQRSGLSSL